MTNDIKKVLSESDTIYAKLISKARKAKGLSKWKNLESISDKLAGKGQAQITFVSHNPKHSGKIRMLTSKDGALEFLSGYVSPAFHFAPWHLQVINPELSNEQAADWFFKMQHPSKITPAMDKSPGPSGDLENGWVHTSVASLYPGRSIALFKAPEIEEPTEVVAPVDVVLDAPEEAAIDPVDMLLVCPYGGGSKCRTNGGSGSPWHHFHSDSMKAHLATFENFEIPKMGTFKGQPAIFFTHLNAPYVALPTKQEIYANTGAVYKWSFLAAGPFALKQPLVSKIMNHLAAKRPVIIPDFGIPEPVVVIAHDVSVSEDVQDAAFDDEVFPLVKDNLPKPGSVINLGIQKGEKLFGVVTSRTVDFYNELGKDSPFPGSDGLYYAYMDLAGKETPAFVLLAFINMFFPNINTTEFANKIEADEENAPSVVTATQPPSGGWEGSPSSAPGAWVGPESEYDTHGANLAKKYAQMAVSYKTQFDLSVLCKPAAWGTWDMPFGAVWAFMYNGVRHHLVQTELALPNYKAQYRVMKNGLALTKCVGTMGNILAALGLSQMSELGMKTPIPVGSSAESLLKGEVVPMDSPFQPDTLTEAINKGLSYIPAAAKKPAKKQNFILGFESSTTDIQAVLSKIPAGGCLRAQGAPVSVAWKPEGGFGLWDKNAAGYTWHATVAQATSYIAQCLYSAKTQYAKESLPFDLFGA